MQVRGAGDQARARRDKTAGGQLVAAQGGRRSGAARAMAGQGGGLQPGVFPHRHPGNPARCSSPRFLFPGSRSGLAPQEPLSWIVTSSIFACK